MTAQPDSATPEQTDANKRRQAYTVATTRLREAHRDEFNKFQQEEAARLGIDWKPRPTEQEKAAATLQRIIREFPDLAEKVTTQP